MNNINIPKIIKIVVVIIVTLIVVLGAFYTVKTGTVGVVYTFGEISSITDPGLHVKLPLFAKVQPFDTRVIKAETQAGAASKDLQSTATTVAVNYSIPRESVENMVKTVGFDYQIKLIDPAVQEAVKASTAKYNAEELITKRGLVKDEMSVYLRERLTKSNIIVHEVSVTNFTFSSSFDAAIEAKVTAEQNALASKNKLEQVKYEAEQKIVTAKAEAESIRIQAAAIQSQGGADYVKLQWIAAWKDGGAKVPNVVSDGNSFLLNISDK